MGLLVYKFTHCRGGCRERRGRQGVLPQGKEWHARLEKIQHDAAQCCKATVNLWLGNNPQLEAGCTTTKHSIALRVGV